ncbi:MAG: hypothetical protein JRH20_32925, partial [Deltaproteobacteria bacterium]|nr:hypothetical protein [Deltaproteobacteria bacterium]
GDRKYEDGALRFLGSAYTFQKDFPRALRRMRQLLALRESAVKKAKPKKRLGAQAKLVKALQKMAWLLLRAKRYDQALKLNERAIALYHAVKRPLLARGAYEQRTVICSKKGDKKQALDYATKAFAVARTQAERSKKKGAKVQAAEACTTVARLQRRDFARYRAAEASAKLARSLLPKLDLLGRSRAEKALKQLLATAPSIKGKAKLVAAKKRAKALRGAIAGERRVAQASLEIQLERIRIQSARGVYADAVALAPAVCPWIRLAWSW